MEYLPITLGVAALSGNAQKAAKKSGNSSLTPDIRQAVLEKDNHTCQFCGFKSTKYQEVHFLDHNPSNIDMDNLATACIFCHQCFDLDLVSNMRSGVLVWLPEIDQADLHHIARAIYVSRISQGTMAESSRSALDFLMKRREDAKARLSTDDPYILSLVMKDFLNPKHYAQREKKLEGVKLFPLDRRIIKEGELEFNQFPQILAFWRSKDGPFGGKAPHQWKNLYAQIEDAA